MWARTLVASAIAIRALSFALFISSGRMRVRLEGGRFELVVPTVDRFLDWMGLLELNWIVDDPFKRLFCPETLSFGVECTFALTPGLRVVGSGMLL